jgi:predicted membrane channel-forming protein YqfA (hemolysin III family)
VIILFLLPSQLLSVTGAVVNVLRVPEKWFHCKEAVEKKIRKAGPFDYWLNSHQIMHVLVTLAMIQLYMAASADYEYASQPDLCSTKSTALKM